MSTDVNQQPHSSDKLDRRKFIGLATAAAGVMFIKPELVHGTAANSQVRVGLLGCGARGTEDASNLVDTGGRRPSLNLVARGCATTRGPSRDEAGRGPGRGIEPGTVARTECKEPPSCCRDSCAGYPPGWWR